MTTPEDVTSQSLVDSISHNKWVTARASLIREYAITETSLKAADEIEALILAEEKRIMDEGDALPPVLAILEAWINATRETAILPR